MAESPNTTISLACPTCGGKMELEDGARRLVCPFCGHEEVIRRQDPATLEYERRMAKARAEQEIEAMKAKSRRRRRLTAWLIALGAVLVILTINVFLPGSPMNGLVFPRKADVFSNVTLRYYGMSGSGTAEVQLIDRSAEYGYGTRFTITPSNGLANGDTVTVRAAAPAGWRFESTRAQFTVEGLTEWVLSTKQLEGSNLDAIHANTERLIREDWDEILSSGGAISLMYTPYKLYLFVADDAPSYHEHNVLYDTYEVTVTRADGTVLTTYEAARYASLKIPEDGVLTADYGDLQGFNFGYLQGFSYSTSFAGWTDADEMEADLRHARDGYKLVK